MPFIVKKRWREVVQVQTDSDGLFVSYGYDFTIKGERLRASGYKVKRDAENEVSRMKTAARFGQFIFPKDEKPAPTMAELREAYIERLGHKGVGKSRLDHVRKVLMRFVDVVENARLNKITSKDVQEYQRWRIKDGLHNHSINHETRIIKGSFNAVRLLYPELKFEPPHCEYLAKQHNGRERVLTDAEVERILDQLDKPRYNATLRDRYPIAKDVFIFAWQTAMRIGEILELTWGNVEIGPGFGYKLGCVFVRKSKTKRERVIPLNPLTLEIMKRRRSAAPNAKPGDLVFYLGNNTTMGAEGVMRQIVQGACKRAKIVWGSDKPEGVVIHTLRHTATTNMLMRGVPVPVVQKITGHSTHTMALRYAHAGVDSLDDAVSRLQPHRGPERGGQDNDLAE